MEHFERAHVIKKKPVKKSKNIIHNEKSQLKQMLQGYKKGDFDIIKSAATSHNYDNSPDSDLDNTVSNVQSPLGSQYEKPSQYDSNIKSNSPGISVNFNKITDTNNSIVSLSNGSHENSVTTSLNSDTSDSKDSEQSEVFDPDGILASEIHKKLRDEKEESIQFIEKVNDSLNKNSRKKDSKVITNHKPKRKKIKDNCVDTQNKARNDKNVSGFHIEYDNKKVRIYNKDIDNDSNTMSSQNNSPPFESITMDNMPVHTLNDVLVNYKSCILKNVPSCSGSQFKTDIFEIGSLNNYNNGEYATINSSPDNNYNANNIGTEEDMTDDTGIKTDTANESQQLIEIVKSYIEDYDYQSSTDIESGIKIYFLNNSCIFVLQHPKEMYINGKVNITALAGTVEVLGYNFNNETCQVYAPNYNYAHHLKTKQTEKDFLKNTLFSKLSSLGVTDIKEIINNLGQYDCVLHLEPLVNRRLEFVERLFNAADLFSKTYKNVNKCFERAADVLGCSLYLRTPNKCFHEDSVWQELNYTSCNQRGIICGGKGTGKSTFLRYYVNKLISRGPVLVLDLDPGQCEFTVAGNLSVTIVKDSLVGPNFTHLKVPNRMWSIGMINVMDNLERYATTVSDLINYCKTTEEFQNMPWIVNTMGMCNSVGLKLIAYVILKLNPTFLVQMDSQIQKKCFEYHLNADNLRDIYFMQLKDDPMFEELSLNGYYEFFLSNYYSDCVKKSNFFVSPRDERFLNYLAYFGQLLDVYRVDTLLEIVPYVVQLKNINVATNTNIEDNLILKVLNGKIVAMCQDTKEINGKTYVLDSKPLVCHGYGLVRGVDIENSKLYIITPVEVEKLHFVNTIMYCDWVPDIHDANRVPAGTVMPYHTKILQKEWHLMKSPRRRFNPLQLLKMTRS